MTLYCNLLLFLFKKKNLLLLHTYFPIWLDGLLSAFIPHLLYSKNMYHSFQELNDLELLFVIYGTVSSHSLFACGGFWAL